MKEMRLGLPGNDTGKGCFPTPGRAPEDHGKNTVGFNSGLDQFAFAQEMLLSHERLQAVRANPFRKGLTLCAGLPCVIFEKIHR